MFNSLVPFLGFPVHRRNKTKTTPLLQNQQPLRHRDLPRSSNSCSHRPPALEFSHSQVWIRVGCLYQELLLNMKTVLTNFLILSFLPRVKMVKYHVHALIAVIKYGLIGRRLERISNVSGLLKATELHLLFPNHVKLLCWMLKMTCKDAKKFYKALEDAKKELYPGCKKFSVLSFIIRLFHSKCIGKCNDKGFSMMLDTLREAFPYASIPKSLYDLRKIIRELGLSYDKIDACPNDCMLYWKENSKKTECDICHTSRYKANENDPDDELTIPVTDKKIGAKVLRHFPLIPRLQRLFMSSKTAASMRWHEESRTKDGYLRHPADSPAWKTFDFNYPDFASESRNVRLGLASDGFNPFRTMSVSHSTWPVVLMPYNLPPWMCMKQPYFFLSLLIPGPSAPGNNIDVYMEPLVAELQELWDINGVETYDASTKSNFKMRASLLWTISDFPAYANLSGWSTKGKLSCPCCHKHTKSQRLTHGNKYCFMGHRRYLPGDHAFRKDKKSFDGTKETERQPRGLTGSEVLDELNGFEIKFGKLVKTNPDLPFNWKKRSIFFELPYWKTNLLRHNLDVMHIEKNVCDSVVGTLMNLDGKTKDHLKARLDLQEMGIRPELHPKVQNNNKVYLPPACFSMDKKEKDIFCRVLKKVKVPDGYAANISRCVELKPPKLFGLKSHDSHILMQQLLPIALRNVLPKHVRYPVMKLCRYYKQLCSKVLNPNDLVQMENEIGKILCDLERIFPPSFFDVMVHLSVHLASEAKLGGTVHYRWMYPIERYLSTLKSYLKNRSKPEGSIAEGYLAEECLSFCSLYISSDVETIHNKTSRNYDDGGFEDILPIFSMSGRPIGATVVEILDLDILAKAHSYVLFNCSEVDEFRIEHLTNVRHENRKLREREIQRLHSETFESWFQDHVEELHTRGDHRITEDLRNLASGPAEFVKKYKGFIINGFRFHTKDLEQNRKTQNSGVMLEAMTNSFSSAKDNNPVMGDVTYYGVLNDIIELEYAVDRKVVLFHCDWISNGSRKKQDENGFTLLNFEGLNPHNDPFILACQAQQVFYVADRVDKGWKVVIKTTPRDSYDMNEQTCLENVETHLQSDTSTGPQLDENMNIELVRRGLNGTVVDKNTLVFDGDEDLFEAAS
ncbi:hypothetical protein HanHA300_Chr05g0170861 [Helianthus annuus]|nr:hypothetical protein HanHA300_Chr05g0170861 [Helianthus annuus]KAJ0584137.1 hypothetical protein HanHA89_Chr05g0185061 [Helianthus annuus]KAJ0749804.1 hypothetical protein HanLR1_Chr05g0174431 [Helianthus annuus]